MILKVQRPLAGAMNDVLIYNKDRSFSKLVPMTDDLRKMFKNKLKFYCEAELKTRELALGKIVPDYDW
jgi:hypothetical protein